MLAGSLRISCLSLPYQETLAEPQPELRLKPLDPTENDTKLELALSLKPTPGQWHLYPGESPQDAPGPVGSQKYADWYDGMRTKYGRTPSPFADETQDWTDAQHWTDRQNDLQDEGNDAENQVMGPALPPHMQHDTQDLFEVGELDAVEAFFNAERAKLDPSLSPAREGLLRNIPWRECTHVGLRARVIVCARACVLWACACARACECARVCGFLVRQLYACVCLFCLID